MSRLPVCRHPPVFLRRPDGSRVAVPGEDCWVCVTEVVHRGPAAVLQLEWLQPITVPAVAGQNIQWAVRGLFIPVPPDAGGIVFRFTRPRTPGEGPPRARGSRGWAAGVDPPPPPPPAAGGDPRRQGGTPEAVDHICPHSRGAG